MHIYMHALPDPGTEVLLADLHIGELGTGRSGSIKQVTKFEANDRSILEKLKMWLPGNLVTRYFRKHQKSTSNAMLERIRSCGRIAAL
jgi:hypothetical protein